MSGRILVVGAAAVLAYLVWFFSGLKVALLPPAVWGAGLLLVIILAAPVWSLWTRTDPKAVDKHVALPTSWWRDMFFYFGLLFLAYLVLQWWNAGRVQYYDVGFNRWTFSLPPHPGWPSAFDKHEAAQMIQWFFPAWVLGLAVRSPVVSRQSLLQLLLFMIYNAGALALFGIVQFLSGTTKLYWQYPMSDSFFASFGYANHAAAYFVLMGAIAAGFLFKETFFAGGGTSCFAHEVAGANGDIGHFAVIVPDRSQSLLEPRGSCPGLVVGGFCGRLWAQARMAMAEQSGARQSAGGHRCHSLCVIFCSGGIRQTIDSQ